LSDTFRLLTFPINFTRGEGQKVPVLVLFVGKADTAGPRTVPISQGQPVVAFTPPVQVVAPTNAKNEAQRVHKRLRCSARQGELVFEFTGGTTSTDSGPIRGQYTSIAFDQTSGANRPLALVYVVGSDSA
jgi:hypothetical protein